MYLPILTYHRLLAQDPTKTVDPKRISVSQDQFRSHLRWLKRLGYRTVRLEDYVTDLRKGRKRNFGGRTFAITFDDGYEEVLSLGLPVLQAFGFSATVFAVPAEERNQWDDGGARLMNADELLRWHEAGMEVGAHTSHHSHLPQLSADDVAREVRESKRSLEQILGQPVSLLAYPYGESNASVQTAVRDAGYAAAFATDHAPRNHAENIYQLRRVVVFPRNTVWEILMKVQRWYPAYQDWKRR